MSRARLMTGADPTTAVGRLEIDHAAIAANWRACAARVAPAEAAAVVKADAYGLGLEPVARTLWRAGARTFFVAELERALALRAVLGEARIFVLYGAPADAADLFAARRLIPVIGERELLARWRERDRALDVALHVETGINRFALSADEAAAIARDRVAALGPLRPVLIMGHLACADAPDEAMNAAQLARFLEIAGGFPDVPKSLANSGGVLLGRDYHFDLARPGVALYGAAPFMGTAAEAREVVRLTTHIAQVKRLAPGETVGYGATFRAARETLIAVCPIGYADGVPRAASNRAEARIGGALAPFAGRVSMDLLTLDASDIPRQAVRPGGEVEIIGPGHGVDALATASGTIGYEVLTGLGRRFARAHINLEWTPE